MHCLYWSTSDPYFQMTKLLTKLRPMPFSEPPAYNVLVPCVALVLTWLVSTNCRLFEHAQPRASRRFRQLVGKILLQSLLSAPTGKRNFWLLPWLVALRRLSTLYVAWTAVANLMIHHRKRNKRLPQPCFATNYVSRTLHGQSLYVPPKFLDRSAGFALWKFCLT